MVHVLDRRPPSRRVGGGPIDGLAEGDEVVVRQHRIAIPYEAQSERFLSGGADATPLRSLITDRTRYKFRRFSARGVAHAVKRGGRVSVTTAHHFIAGKCIFCFGDASAALADHRELRERERIVRLQFNNLLGVSDRFVELPQLVHDHGQGRVRQRVRRRLGDDAQQRGRRSREVALVFESVGIVIQFIGRRHQSGFLERVGLVGKSSTNEERLRRAA